MLLLRACPHCHGDLASEEDDHTGYLCCVQCGHILSTAEERRLGVRVTRKGVINLSPHPHGAARHHVRRATARMASPAQTVR